MLSTYSSVKVLAREHNDWVEVVAACYEISKDFEEFAGAWIVEYMGRWLPNLRILARYGIIEKIDTSRGGKRAYYRMVNREEVGKALGELGILRQEKKR